MLAYSKSYITSLIEDVSSNIVIEIDLLIRINLTIYIAYHKIVLAHPDIR